MKYWYLCVFPLDRSNIDIFGKTLSLLHNITSNHTSISVSLISTWQERRSHKARGWAQQGRGGRRWRCGSPRWRRPPRPSYFLVSHFTHLERHCSLDSLDLKIPKALISASPPRPSYFLVSLACVVFWKAQSNQVIIAHSIFVTSSYYFWDLTIIPLILTSSVTVKIQLISKYQKFWFSLLLLPCWIVPQNESNTSLSRFIWSQISNYFLAQTFPQLLHLMSHV